MDVESPLDWVEVDNLLEEVKVGVADDGVGEVSDRGVTGPGDDADEDDSSQDGALEAVHHEHDGEDTTAEDTDPHGGVAHLGRGGAEAINLLARNAASQLEGGGSGANNQTDTLAVGETDEGEEETDTDTGGEFDGAGDGASEPLTQTEQGEAEEDEALDEDGSKGDLVRDGTGSVVTDDGVGKVGVQAHTGSATDGHVGEEAHEEGGQGRNSGGSGDDVTLDLCHAEHVVLILVASEVVGVARADAGTAGIGDDGGVDGDNVGHGEEGDEAGAHLGEEE